MRMVTERGAWGNGAAANGDSAGGDAWGSGPAAAPASYVVAQTTDEAWNPDASSAAW